MRIHVIGLLFLFLVAATKADTQTPDAAALKPSFDALVRALNEKEMTSLLPMLDPSFRVGDYSGDTARGILRQVISSGRIQPRSIGIDTIRPEGANFRISVSLALASGSRTYDTVVTKDGRFVEINLMRVQAASPETRVDGSTGGVSLGAAPASPGSVVVSDPALRAELLAMLQDDQRHRGALTEAVKTGADLQTPALKQIEIEQEELDRAALAKLQRVLDSRGWPSATLVGRDAQEAAFLVLQHAPAEVQEKYLPMAREAHRTGELPGSSLALLEDRVLMRRGKKQLYGTQMHTKHGSQSLQVWPIEDEANVDARRKAMGLEPLADYLRRFNIR